MFVFGWPHSLTTWFFLVAASLFVGETTTLHYPANASETQPPKMKTISVNAIGAPTNVWHKKRLASEINDGVVRITDNELDDFNDASLWEIKFDQKLPYGRKILSFNLDLGKRHKTLWGQSVLSPLINGKPAVPATGLDGKPNYKAIHADDGRAYVPLGASTIRLSLNSKVRSLQNLSFVLAGASAMDVRLRDFVVYAWPTADPGTALQGLVTSSLPFQPADQKIVLFETPASKSKDPPKEILASVQGPKGASSVKLKLVPEHSKASGSRVSQIDLSPVQIAGEYTLTIPPFALQPKPSSVTLSITPKPDPIIEARDAAWSAFYWITDNQNGPYKSAHLQDQFTKVFGHENKRRDIRGGWFDAGDYGKYSVNGAYSASLMLLTGLLAPDVLDHPIKLVAGGSSHQPDWLSVVEAELMWLLTMQDKNGGVNHKVATRNFPGMDITPQADDQQKWIMPVSSTATAGFAATMSLAALVYQRLPDDMGKLRAGLFKSAAQRAHEWLSTNSELKMIEAKYDNAEYGGAYHDDDDTDERFFAKAAEAALSRDPKTVLSVQNLLNERRAGIQSEGPVLDWRSVDLLALWTLKLSENMLDEPSKKLVDLLLDNAAASWSKTKQRTPWQISIADDAEFPWGSNGVLATTGWHWMLWSKVSGKNQFSIDASDQLNWFFGRNPLGKTFVTGDYPNSSKAPHFRPWTSGAIKLPNGLLVGGPNSEKASRTAFDISAPMRMYVDEIESYTTNEVAINWQAVWALYLSLVSASALQ